MNLSNLELDLLGRYGLTDAFGRVRVSSPKTMLDLKQSVDNLPLFYDDSQVSGSGTTSTYLTNKASTRISVSANTAGHRVRQSFLWGNYQPGKGQLINITFSNILTGTGITKRAGYFWDNWGIFIQNKDGVASVGIRTYNTGSAIDRIATQTNWNIDKMDGTGPSKIIVDWTKTQLIAIDFQWLSVGRVRLAVNIDGILYYIHEFLNANILAETYMSNPNAPIRYEIINDGTGGTDYFDTICASIQSEGGQEQTAISTYISRDGTPITLATQDLRTPVVSFRLKSNRRCTRITPKEIAIIATTSTNYEWALFLEPTIAGVDNASWVSVDNSALEYDMSRNNTNTLSGGYKVSGGYGSSTNQTKGSVVAISNSFLTIGSKINGTSQQFVLGVKNIDADGGTIYGGLNIAEYC